MNNFIKLLVLEFSQSSPPFLLYKGLVWARNEGSGGIWEKKGGSFEKSCAWIGFIWVNYCYGQEKWEGCTLRENILKKEHVCGGMEGIIVLEMGQKSK